MGFLDEYEVDLDNYEDTGGFDIADGLYTFVVINGELKEGTAKDPDARHIVISFQFENEDGESNSYNWWLKVPDDPSRPTRRESISMSEWKKWLLAAGFDASEINGVGPEDVEALTGTVRLVTGKPGKGGVAYQNPKDWTFDTEEEEPVKRAAPKKSAPRKAAPVEEPEEDDEEEVEETPAPRRRTKENPFKK